MNTVVFVLFAMTHGVIYIPTMEFSTMEKCEVLRKELIIEYNDSGASFLANSQKKYLCKRVEK